MVCLVQCNIVYVTIVVQSAELTLTRAATWCAGTLVLVVLLECRLCAVVAVLAGVRCVTCEVVPFSADC